MLDDEEKMLGHGRKRQRTGLVDPLLSPSAAAVTEAEGMFNPNVEHMYASEIDTGSPDVEDEIEVGVLQGGGGGMEMDQAQSQSQYSTTRGAQQPSGVVPTHDPGIDNVHIGAEDDLNLDLTSDVIRPVMIQYPGGTSVSSPNGYSSTRSGTGTRNSYNPNSNETWVDDQGRHAPGPTITDLTDPLETNLPTSTRTRTRTRGSARSTPTSHKQPNSYEIEKDRIVITSLSDSDDSSSTTTTLRTTTPEQGFKRFTHRSRSETASSDAMSDSDQDYADVSDNDIIELSPSSSYENNVISQPGEAGFVISPTFLDQLNWDKLTSIERDKISELVRDFGLKNQRIKDIREGLILYKQPPGFGVLPTEEAHANVNAKANADVLTEDTDSDRFELIDEYDLGQEDEMMQDVSSQPGSRMEMVDSEPMPTGMMVEPDAMDIG